MQDRLLVRIKHIQDVVGISARVEKIPDVERLQMLIAVELLVVGVGDGIELRLVMGQKHRLGIASEIAARHRHDMNTVTGDQLGQVRAKFVLGVG